MTKRQLYTILGLKTSLNLTDEWHKWLELQIYRPCNISMASKIIDKLLEIEREQSPDPRRQFKYRINAGKGTT